MDFVHRMTKKIGVLWSVLTTTGKVSNAGNYLICERGKELLEIFFEEDFKFDYLERTKHFVDEYDGYIILGGPVISRRIHHQSKIIEESILDKKKPVICLGLGISGTIISDENKYFLDDDSIRFWKYVYDTSELFSVRDTLTRKILNQHEINAVLTGCPALFNLRAHNIIKKKLEGKKSKILISIPHFLFNVSLRGNLSRIKPFVLTLYFLYQMNKKLGDHEIGLVYQHGCDTILMKIIDYYAKKNGIRPHYFLGKSLDSPELAQYDIQIGTRLHSHINFLTQKKPSYLLNVDMRTHSFLKTICTPHQDYTFSGTKEMVNLLSDNISRDDFAEFSAVSDEIQKLFGVMNEFIQKIPMAFQDKSKFGPNGD